MLASQYPTGIAVASLYDLEKLALPRRGKNQVFFGFQIGSPVLL